MAYHLIKPGMSSSGLCRVESDGEGVNFDLVMVDPMYPHLSSLNKQGRDNKYKAQVISESFRFHSMTVDLAVPITVMSLGSAPFVIDQYGEGLAGNYGVIHQWDITLRNSGIGVKKLALSLVPLGGVARGTVFMDGQLKESAVLQPDTLDEHNILDQIVLQPKEIRKVQLITMPQAGSTYPVNVMFQTRNHVMMVTK